MQPISSHTETPTDDGLLTISPENVYLVIMKAREFDAVDEVTEPDSNDEGTAILEDDEEDPVLEGLISLVKSLSDDEQIDLMALAWLARDDYSAGDWPLVREEAARAHNERTIEFLIGTPLLGGFLEEGLSMLGYTSADEPQRLEEPLKAGIEDTSAGDASISGAGTFRLAIIATALNHPVYVCSGRD